MTNWTIQLRAKGNGSTNLKYRLVGRISFDYVELIERPDTILVVQRDGPLIEISDLKNYAAILFENGAESRIGGLDKLEMLNLVSVSGYEHLSFLCLEDIVAINPPNGQLFRLYRSSSSHNNLFVTGRCNSNCLMCSQPPIFDNHEGPIEESFRILKLIKTPPKVLGITGGEPTLLDEKLVILIKKIYEKFPETDLFVLTNGRKLSDKNLTKELAEIGHKRLLFSVPLHADTADRHDYIVQAKNSFDETIKGLYNAACDGLSLEIRTVLQAQTLPRLLKMMEFIYRNVPFISHVALMGLENMGYVKKNWNLLWIDPIDYIELLVKAVKFLFYRGIYVSIYNLPLCILPPTVWSFARQSISDYKNFYLPECYSCTARLYCSGLFASSENYHSRGIHQLSISEEEIKMKINGFGRQSA